MTITTGHTRNRTPLYGLISTHQDLVRTGQGLRAVMIQVADW